MSPLAPERVRIRGEVARHVAEVLIREPEQFAKMEIGEVLKSIPYVTRERARRWLARAGVNPMRLGSELTYEQRGSLALTLAIFARNPSV